MWPRRNFVRLAESLTQIGLGCLFGYGPFDTNVCHLGPVKKITSHCASKWSIWHAVHTYKMWSFWWVKILAGTCWTCGVEKTSFCPTKSQKLKSVGQLQFISADTKWRIYYCLKLWRWQSFIILGGIMSVTWNSNQCVSYAHWESLKTYSNIPHGHQFCFLHCLMYTARVIINHLC